MKPAMRHVAVCTLSATMWATIASAQDPAVVNANVTKVKLENSRVRVLETTLQPGDKELPHSHPAHVVYVISGGKIRTRTLDGKTTDADLVPGATLYREPLSHTSENIGSTPIHVILVELKSPPQVTDGSPQR